MAMDYTQSAIRRSKTPFVLGVLALIAALVMQNWYIVEEQRWYRDLTGATPFRNVHVDVSTIDDQTIMFTGHFEKERCDPKEPIEALIWYISDHSADQVTVDTSKDDGGTFYSRLPSEGSRAFGPWFVKAPRSNPVRWEMWVRHTCPEGQVVNKFAKGVWP